jgi:hypothetical protein
MAEIKYTTQIRFTGSGPLDVKIAPVKTFNDLTLIPRTQRYVGMVVTVLSDENNSKRQTDYWLSGGTLNSNWVQKTSSSDIFISGDDVEQI